MAAFLKKTRTRELQTPSVAELRGEKPDLWASEKSKVSSLPSDLRSGKRSFVRLEPPPPPPASRAQASLSFTTSTLWKLQLLCKAFFHTVHRFSKRRRGGGKKKRKDTSLGQRVTGESFLTIWTLSVAHKRQISRCHCKKLLSMMNYIAIISNDTASFTSTQHRCMKNGAGWQENELLMTHLSIITENQWAYLV